MTSINHINADAIPAIRTLPDKAYDLLLIDPPYGINGNFYRRTLDRGVLPHLRREYHNAIWEQKPPTPEEFDQLFRVSKNQIVFGANYFERFGPVHKPPRRKDLTLYLNEHPNGWFVWDKCNADTTTFNDVEIAWTSFAMPSYVFKFMWNGMMQGKSESEGSRMNGRKNQNEKRIHPTQKPEIVYRHLLRRFTSPGDTVLDAYAGSGTMLRAAMYIGNLNVTAYEIEKVYFDDSRTELQHYVKKSPLFEPNVIFL